MRWVFIRPFNNSPYYDPEIQEPLGLESLASSRREEGDFVLILDCALDHSSDTKIARRAVSFHPNAIGFSITTAQELDSVLAVYAECFRLLDGKAVRWLAGGNFISSEPFHADRYLPKDFILVQFEGENALRTIVNSWTQNGKPLTSGSNQVSSRQIYKGECVENLDTLPFPDRSYADQILQNGWAFNIQGSRGCCGTCKYCASPGMTEGGFLRWRGRSPKHIMEEIDWLHRTYGACTFNFVDEDFLGPSFSALQRAKDFCSEVRKRKLPVTFGIQVRPCTLSDEIVDALADVGVRYVFMGIESDDTEDFKRWGRPWTGNVWRFVEQLQTRGVEVNAGVLLFHTHSTFGGIRRFACNLKGHGLLNYRTAINRMDAMPGSLYYQMHMKGRTLNTDAMGPQPLPLMHPEIEFFHKDLLFSIGPIGPPSMHAICTLPAVVTQQVASKIMIPAYRELKRIILYMDRAIHKTFFALLDCHEKGIGQTGLANDFHRQNVEIAIKGAKDLVEHGFAPSFDQLREGIRLDSGA